MSILSIFLSLFKKKKTARNSKCLNKKTGKALASFSTKAQAESSAQYEKKAHNADLYAYKCEKCGLFHLAPIASKISVKHNACSCRDSKGQPKALYGSKADAEKQRIKSEKEQKIKLRVYECPQKKGFHLTHTQKR